MESSDWDGRQERKRELLAEFAAQDASEEEADLAWLLSTARGRREVWRRLSQARVFHTTFDPDPARMAFAQGQRDAGLRLLEAVTRHPQALATMMQEAHDRDRDRRAVLDRAD